MNFESNILKDMPLRGFAETEFFQRTEHLQRAMRDNRLDAVLLTTEANVRYFSGFFTQFWESPTRPWFLVVPADGKPVAIIPEIGAIGMETTWIEDIRTWASPCPTDDGISLLVDCFRQLPHRFGRVGMTLGAESMVRMPLNNWMLLKQKLSSINHEIVDIGQAIQHQRMIKSPAEIDKIRYICQIASASFAALPNFATVGMSEMEICKRMRIDLLNRGADAIPYMVAASGNGGYDNIIMGPTERRVSAGDLFMIDTGATWDGYFCDFDRNFTFGDADARTCTAYEVIWKATEAGFSTAHPGATTTDLWQAMNAVLVAGGSLGNEVGRLGHGLGMQLTECPSHTHDDHTELLPGMVITLEPGMTIAPGMQMVHEENIVITEDGAKWLTCRASEQLPVIPINE